MLIGKTEEALRPWGDKFPLLRAKCAESKKRQHCPWHNLNCILPLVCLFAFGASF